MNCSQTRIPDPPSGLSDVMLVRLSSHVATLMGLHFPRAKWQALEKAFCSAARELGFQNPEECADWFITTPLSRELVETMAGYLTIGETYFLREFRSLEILTEDIIPGIIRERRGTEQRLRIWSAGCSTGEESYSIAILLHRMRDALRDWDISILATDINPLAIRKASGGVYTEWSFRNTPSWLKENYFKKSGTGSWTLISPIKKMVDFSYLNLVDDQYPSLPGNTNAMDIIFCRNVLMYLTPDRARNVVQRFHRSLVDGGWLIVSPCETSQVLYPQFNAVSFRDAVLYRKQGIGEAVKSRSGEAEKRGSGEVKQMEEVSPILPFSHSPFQDVSPLHPFPVSPFQDVPPSPFQAVSPVPPVSVSPIQGSSPSPYEEALALYEQGLYSEAEQKIAALLPPNQENVNATALLCRIRANQGRLAEARLLLEQAIATDKLNPGLHNLLAMILQEQGEDHAAVAALKRALYLDQDLVLAHFALANIELRKGKIKESRRHFDNALSLLDRYRPDEVVPESDGMLAWRLKEIIRGTTARM